MKDIARAVRFQSTAWVPVAILAGYLAWDARPDASGATSAAPFASQHAAVVVHERQGGSRLAMQPLYH